MAVRDLYVDNVLRERWDDGTRTYTAYSATGSVTSTRPYTAAENVNADALVTAAAEQANHDTIVSQATTAISSNQTYLGIASPTNAQVVAQDRALTQQMNTVIRLVIAKLDGTD
jgi:hypothetical protein